jgi:uncharacterized protein
MNTQPIIDDVSGKVRSIELAWIPMSDGRRLAARLWLPIDAEKNPVPAILEYIPYRRRDGTRMRDEETHPWIAARGYACARVDITGTGDSDGLIHDEYLKREQDDALEIIAWLAAQPWCSGSVGMIGISWGGFNGLQVAARRPPALKAVISLSSTVDRYADDAHFMGGCIIADNMDWGGAFFAYAALPPDPAMVGKDWQKRWLERLEIVKPFPAVWLEHQRRDDFWRHGSVCEDYSAIQCPVLSVSGWADGYTAAVFDLVENLKVPCKGLVGPWGHLYPHRGVPDPAIGFLQECVRWWDRWLKGKQTGVENDPALRLWVQESVPPKGHYDYRPGRWVGLDKWPSASTEMKHLALNAAGLSAKTEAAKALTLSSPQTTGVAGGEWCAYGLGKVAPEMPLDQRIDDVGSLTFDSEPLKEPLTIIGSPVVTLSFSSDKPAAFVVARLSTLGADGSATRVSYGVLNLAHRDSHANPTALEPGKKYRVSIPMTEAGHVFAAGERVRVSLSSCYWPMVWPSPEPVTLTVFAGESEIALPTMPAKGMGPVAEFAPVRKAKPLKLTNFSPDLEQRQMIYDAGLDKTTMRNTRHDGSMRIDDIGTVRDYGKVKEFSISQNDPLTAETIVSVFAQYDRDAGPDQEPWHARLETRIRMRADRTHFIFHSHVDAFADGERFFTRSFEHRVKRDLV